MFSFVGFSIRFLVWLIFVVGGRPRPIVEELVGVEGGHGPPAGRDEPGRGRPGASGVDPAVERHHEGGAVERTGIVDAVEGHADRIRGAGEDARGASRFRQAPTDRPMCSPCTDSGIPTYFVSHCSAAWLRVAT